MSASITISNLSWSTPDGRTLFSNLDLSFGAERSGFVGRNGIGKSTLLKLISGDLTSQSGKVSVNGNLGILRQAVEVSPDGTIADLFGATEDLAILRRAELVKPPARSLQSWTGPLKHALLPPSDVSG